MPFPIIIRKEHIKPNPWITSGIKISCATKRHLYVSNKFHKNPSQKAHYKNYCILSIIKEDKKMYYVTVIQKANKVKATWNIVKTVTNNNYNNKK